jgi:hypothetical protein
VYTIGSLMAVRFSALHAGSCPLPRNAAVSGTQIKLYYCSEGYHAAHASAIHDTYEV